MDNSHSNSNSYGYAVSGKIMLSAIIVLFTVVIALVCLHLYARWYLQRARRRHNLRRRNQRTNTTSTHHVFYVDPNNNNPNGVLPIGSNHGLDASVLKSLPVFAYGSEESKEMMVVECAVCLSEFEDKEMMRCLPKCNHCFHIGCIDMWFHSHSTCPLCRSPVESDHRFQSSSTDTGSVDFAEVAVVVNESVVVDATTTDGVGSSSEFCSSCIQHDEGEANRVRSSSSSSSSMFGMRRKPSLVLPIEIPRRSDDDFRADSPSSASQSYKSPVGRIRSFRRMLSRGIPSPSSGAETSCGPSELDIEQGRDRLTPRNRVETPR